MADVEDRDLWARVLKADEASHLLVLEREDWAGAAVFTNPAEGDRNLAVIGQATTEAADDLLEALVRHFRAAGVTPRVRVTPLSTPADWPERLARRGFAPVREEDEVFMIRKPAGNLPLTVGVTVKRVPLEATEEDFARVQHAGWGGDEAGYDHALDLTRRGVVAGAFRYFLAYLNGEAAGAATAHLEDGVAGVYGVTTLPAFRRCGVATSIVAYIAGLAWQEGCGTVFLSAEPGGEATRIYGKLGFAPAFTVRNYALNTPLARDADQAER